MGKKIHQNRLKEKFIKINPNKGGGSTLKIFGDELNPSIPYKTFLLSIKDTAEWIVKEMLEKYGLKHENSQNYCLIQILIPLDNKNLQEILLHDKECPLNIYLNYKQKNSGSIIFKIIKCPSEYTDIRKSLHIEDRILPNHFPMFIEMNKDGTDHPTPRLFKIHPNTTHVGCDLKPEIAKQNCHIENVGGVNRDYCIIENKNDIVTIIPDSEIWLNGKVILTSFILQHGDLIGFGRNSIFRYYDQKMKSLGNQRKQQNGTMYASLPLLPINDVQSGVLQKKISSTNVVDPGTKLNVLPGLLEVPIETEIPFLHAVFNNYPLTNIHFRLSPVYTLYMTLRHRLSPFGKSNILFVQKQEDILSLLYRIEEMINKKIEECQEHVGYLVYWLANTSELVYFLKRDEDLSKISYDIRIRLIESIQRLFYYLINLLQNELDKYLIAFTNPQNIHTILDHRKSSEIRWIISDQISNEYHQSTLDDTLAILSSIIDLFRKCRVNAALTIEVYSQIFHYINAWLFNRIVCCPELKLCSNKWGEKLLNRLKLIHDWAEKQGLELSSEYHLMKVNQLCLLLKNPKRDIYDVQQLILNNTFQINSIQITQIFNNYILNTNEPQISNNFSQALLFIAYKHVDENLHRDGFCIQLAEESDLNLPFLLPEDGYICDNLRGIPQQLLEFIEPINQSLLCRLFTNSYSLGMWTEFMQISNIDNGNERIETIVLNKKNNSLGLSIVSAKNESQQFQGIYIKGIIPGSAAEDNGHLQLGDQILSVDQISLINVTQEQATEFLKQCGPSVTLQILKDAANHHGLSSLFISPSKTHHQLEIPSLDSTEILMNKQTYYQSDSNLFYSKEQSNNFNRNISKTQPFIVREDVPTDEMKSINHNKGVIPPKTLPKPMINRIRTNDDQFSQFYDQEISPRSPTEYDEKLKRRLEEFEQERAIERAYFNRMSIKREAEIEANLRNDREREIRAYRDMQDFQIQRMSVEDRILKAKKEQERLLKHMCLPNKKHQQDKPHQ